MNDEFIDEEEELDEFDALCNNYSKSGHFWKSFGITLILSSLAAGIFLFANDLEYWGIAIPILILPPPIIGWIATNTELAGGVAVGAMQYSDIRKSRMGDIQAGNRLKRSQEIFGSASDYFSCDANIEAELNETEWEEAQDIMKMRQQARRAAQVNDMAEFSVEDAEEDTKPNNSINISLEDL